MRANLPEREPEFLKFWEDIDLYHLVLEKSRGKPKFVLHDGPPYANGDIHLGTALNKILKDFVIKFYTAVGYDAPFVPGWDTHGLPIEQQAIKELNLNPHELDVVAFRNYCRDYALKYVEIQKEEFRRLGVRGDWKAPYLTLTPSFEAAQVGVFGEMAQKGYIYKGLKPVYWCSTCETALAEAEVEYEEKESPSIYVLFPIQEGGNLLPPGASFVIWTTTPWTLPANVAVALHPDYAYALVKTEKGSLIMAEELLTPLQEEWNLKELGVQKRFKGKELEGLLCIHPWHLDQRSLVITGEYVTLAQGTGCVHIAPGHGLEDYELGQRYSLPVVSPLDARGCFTPEGGKKITGLKYQAANKVIMEELAQRGFLFSFTSIRHQYPHCWRCKKPVIFRATPQWFASVAGFREKALAAIEGVKWIPGWGKERIFQMVAERSDWCISRQRTWGVPIPAFYCKFCGEPVITSETIAHLQGLFARHGSGLWFQQEAKDLLPPGFACPYCGHTSFEKEKDIMDVWFDSGTTHAAVLTTHPHLAWPADLYLEGSDQHRGWFQSSLLTAVATKGEAPYRAVLTHGYVVDEEGRKMSKSLGNVVDPLAVIKEWGADVLRLWVASTDYRRDVAASPQILKQVVDAYRKIRNTFRFILGNLFDFVPARDTVRFEELEEIDRWALLQTHRLIENVTSAYYRYEFHQVYRALYEFCTLTTSALYFDVLKDRLYTAAAQSRERRAAQTVLAEIGRVLACLFMPILAFTTEEVWRHLPKPTDAPLSVQLAPWPVVEEKYLDAEREIKWRKLLAVRAEVLKALEEARKKKLIGNSLEAKVCLFAGEKYYQFLKPELSLLPTLFIVSAVELQPAPQEAQRSLEIKVSRAPGKKCVRCWVYSPTVGENVDHPDLCARCVPLVTAPQSPCRK